MTRRLITLGSPPLSWYSRKPIVVLTSPPRPDPATVVEGSPEQFEDSLDRHVDDVLKRPSKVRRTLKGVWSFVKTRQSYTMLNFCILTYTLSSYGCALILRMPTVLRLTCLSSHRSSLLSMAFSLVRSSADIHESMLTLISVFWGAAIVIFLAKIINFHNENTQGFWVEVSSQVTNGEITNTPSHTTAHPVIGLFTVTGIGLIPSRVLDTYRQYQNCDFNDEILRFLVSRDIQDLALQASDKEAASPGRIASTV